MGAKSVCHGSAPRRRSRSTPPGARPPYANAAPAAAPSAGCRRACAARAYASPPPFHGARRHESSWRPQGSSTVAHVIFARARTLYRQQLFRWQLAARLVGANTPGRRDARDWRRCSSSRCAWSTVAASSANVLPGSHPSGGGRRHVAAAIPRQIVLGQVLGQAVAQQELWPRRDDRLAATRRTRPQRVGAVRRPALQARAHWSAGAAGGRAAGRTRSIESKPPARDPKPPPVR